MDTCKGIIYSTLTSKLPNKRCTNKPKDINGFCGVHSKQSKNFETGIVNFKVRYNANETCIKMKSHREIGTIINAVNEKFGIQDSLLTCDNRLIDLSLPASIFDGKILDLKDRY